MGWHQILGLLCSLFFLHSSLPFASPLCPPDHRDALLLFKDSFVLDSMASDSCDLYQSYPKTNSWNKTVDCCSWDGVTCDGVTGDVIGLDLSCSWLHGTLHSNSSLILLCHLRSLSLSGNDFLGSQISPNLSSFAKMTHLNLSRSHFSGIIPGEISRLSKLESLDLSYNNDETNSWSFSSLVLENSIFTMLVQNLSAVRKLVLDEVDMFMVSPMSFVNLSSSLTHLKVFGCYLGGIFPDTVFRLPSLTTLSLRYNLDLFGTLPKSNWTGPLVYLSLGSTSFSGEIPDSIGNMTALTILDLSVCKFTGHSPSSLWNLKQLQVLDLAWNNFSGVVEFEVFTKLQNLRLLNVSLELNLAYNTLKYKFPKLEVLGLPSCNLTKFPHFLNSLKILTRLDLSFNRIRGEIPRWFRGISRDTLELLDLSHNLLEGGIQLLHWKRLLYINLWNNSFQGPLPIPPPSTSFFSASNNGFTSEIPTSICQLSSLWYLDLSNNNLSRNMPSCFGNMANLLYLDLRNNKLQGSLPRSLVKSVDLSVLLLGHNEFNDIFPHWLEAPDLEQLDLEHNQFHGRVNLIVFGLSFPALEAFFVANNNFTGQWPTEIFSNTSLVLIDLSNNKFGGPIPLPSPVTFYYSIASNMMTGKIPSLICNATKLEIIDLSNNGLTGILPRCLTNFSTHLSVLNLQKNHLEGTIPQSFCRRNTLTTLDLSRNQFEGTLPRSLVHCKYLEVLDLGDNQIEDMFPTWLGTLPELKVLVLKSNNFKGLLNIPRGAHLFSKLYILDLSNNNFGGSIPVTLGNLTNLEWLDLSSNKLGGVIPRTLGDLAYLGYLNLSKNQLTGQIPQDNQLSTFSNDSFDGNPGLCGTPLTKPRPHDAQPPPPSSPSTFDREGHENSFKDKTVWILIGYTSGFVIGNYIAYIAYEMGTPRWFALGVRILERRAAKWMEERNRKAIKFHGQ